MPEQTLKSGKPGNTAIRSGAFQAAIIMLLAAAGVAVMSYVSLYPVDAWIGPLQLYHWAGVLGSSIVAVFVPVYSITKRRRPNARKSLFGLHMYVNLAGFILVCMHAGVLGQLRPEVDTGTGFLLFSVLILLVFTGVLRRFQLVSRRMQVWRFLHLSLTVSFYIVIVNHVLGVIGIV